MSRIGKKPVTVPKGVKVSVANRVVKVEGPKGTLTMTHRPEVGVAVKDNEVVCTIDESRAEETGAKAYWGTTRALIDNMIEGVTKGYQKKMEVVGVGWTAAVAGKQLKMTLGFANPIMMDIPAGVNVLVEKQIVTVSGADKQAVGQFAAEMRQKRKPEPYNGKGVKYVDEVIKKKQGKQFGS
jgi:large subunit ribosomal protein L6